MEDQTYRTKRRTTVRGAPHGDQLIRLGVGVEFQGKPAATAGWVVWVEGGEVRGYVLARDVMEVKVKHVGG